MTDLAAWLLERIADDEAVARAATSLGYGWDADGLAGDVYASGDDPQTGTLVAEAGEHADAAHIARWDPDRVLAECVAKRRIVEAHEQVKDYFDRDDPDALTGCQCCDWDSDCQTVMPNDEPGCYTLRLLALPYVTHAGYNEAWRP